MKYFYLASTGLLALVLIIFFFVPAFAGHINIPSQIPIGNFAIRIYGIIIAAAVLVGYFVARFSAWRFGISREEVDDIAFWITIFAILGARIYYVLINWSYFSANVSEIYKIWHGGISIYGGIIAGIIFILLYGRNKAYSVYQLLDLAAIALPLAQALGRFGNFFNQEAFGIPTNLPWKMYVSILNRPEGYQAFSYFHPTFLYEALWSVAVYFILTKFLMVKAKPGVIAGSYLGLYSVGRFFIEGLRLDSSYIHGVKVDQITAVVGVLLAGLIISYRQGVLKPQPKQN